MQEVDPALIQQIRDYQMKQDEIQWTPYGGSPWRKWYRSQAKPDAQRKQHIFWKKSKPYEPKNIFFKTVDTGRLLPMSTALFRLQFYAHKSKWDHLDSQNKKPGFIQTMTAALVSGNYYPDVSGLDVAKDARNGCSSVLLGHGRRRYSGPHHELGE